MTGPSPSPSARGIRAGRPRGQGKTTRLGVVLERISQYRLFLRSLFGSDKEEQTTTAVLFTQSLQGADLRTMFGLPPRLPHAEVRADKIFVCFDDFERVAKWEAHDLAANSGLEDFTAGLGIEDQFWCFQRFAGPPMCSSTATSRPAPLRLLACPEMGRHLLRDRQATR